MLELRGWEEREREREFEKHEMKKQN